MGFPLAADGEAEEEAEVEEVTLQGAREPCDAGATFAGGSSDGPHDGAKTSAAGPARGRLPLGGKRKRVVPGE